MNPPFLIWLRSFFEETPGVASSMRVMAILATVNIFTVWTVISIRQGQLQVIDWSVAGLLAAMWGCKVIQHFSEK